MKLTNRQAEVLAFIRNFIADEGYPPTLRDIGRHFGITVNAIICHLRALERKGHITRKAGMSRAIRVLHICETTTENTPAV